MPGVRSEEPGELLSEWVPVAMPLDSAREAEFVFTLDGKWVGASVRRTDGDSLRSGDLRVPWNQLLRSARAELQRVLFDLVSAADEELYRHGIDAGSSQHPDAQRVRRIDAYLDMEHPSVRTRRGVPSKPEHFYLNVARVYAGAAAAGKAARKAVWLWGRQNGEPTATPNTAGQWVIRCRPGALGYLTAAPAGGKQGGALTPLALRLLARLANGPNHAD